MLASGIVIGLDLSVPRWLANTTEILGGLLIPGMLLMLGASLARLGITRLPKVFTLALLRLLLGIGASFAVIQLFDLQGMAAGVMFLQGTMPVAVFNFVFAERYEREPDQVAALVLVSTLLALATLPFLVAYSMELGGVTP